MSDLIIQALFETLLMVFASSLIGIVFGFPLAMILFNYDKMSKGKLFYHILSFLVNASRSIPYIILVVLMIPFSRMIVGSSIGVYAAIIPLGVSAILLVARIIEDAFNNVASGLIEVGVAMGASKLQIFLKILIPEALPNIVAGITLVAINLVGFSAMAGAVGGGGLGDLAIRYGYQRYDLEILAIIVLILILLVQIIQIIGNKISNQLKR